MKYVHPDNMVCKAQEHNDKDHKEGVEKNIHYDQISGFDNMKVEKEKGRGISVAGKDKK